MSDRPSQLCHHRGPLGGGAGRAGSRPVAKADWLIEIVSVFTITIPEKGR